MFRQDVNISKLESAGIFGMGFHVERLKKNKYEVTADDGYSDENGNYINNDITFVVVIKKVVDIYDKDGKLLYDDVKYDYGEDVTGKIYEHITGVKKLD